MNTRNLSVRRIAVILTCALAVALLTGIPMDLIDTPNFAAADPTQRGVPRTSTRFGMGGAMIPVSLFGANQPSQETTRDDACGHWVHLCINDPQTGEARGAVPQVVRPTGYCCSAGRRLTLR